MKNITLSIPDDLLAKSREYSTKHGTSLNELVRSLLRKYTASENENPVDNLLSMSANEAAPTVKWNWNRDELYDR